MLTRLRQICQKFQIPRCMTRRQMSEKGQNQAMKFDIGSGDKKQTFTIMDGQEQQRVANSYYNWFSTAKGQKVVGSIWIGLSAAGALYHVVPQWFFLPQIRGIYQSYSKGFKTQVRNELLELLNVVAKDMDLSDDEISSLTVFVTTTTEPNGWGELGKESILGIPEYFHYTSGNDVPMDKMRIGETHASGSENLLLNQSQIESEQGKSFEEALVLSDNAKKFAIAREIGRTQYTPFMMHGVFAFCFIGLTYNIARIINKQLQFHRRPPLIRGMMYVSLLPTIIFSYFFTKDTYNRHVEKSLDKKAAGVSLEYCAGGFEYYNKMLQRNIALRHFQGDAGRNKYTGKGELIQGIIRLKTAPITERRDICAKQNFIKATNS